MKLLVEADEVGAFLGVLKRIAERRAFRGAQRMEWEEADRWQKLGAVVAAIEHDLQRRRKSKVN